MSWCLRKNTGKRFPPSRMAVHSPDEEVTWAQPSAPYTQQYYCPLLTLRGLLLLPRSRGDQGAGAGVAGPVVPPCLSVTAQGSREQWPSFGLWWSAQPDLAALLPWVSLIHAARTLEDDSAD
ncbi:Hypothetical predicted protein [Marmota monax]|uniref:Uncharacterized protein n=1 Tax=Marmota monax TaxID=9995 RepID=A0A5E4B6G1_MARMO|nr:Hypothetical predicted protein [Marmota monax]